MNILSIPRKVITRMLKKRFASKFKHFDRSSAIGSNGCGNGCKVQGKERISIGQNTWIEEGCELTAIKNHFTQVLNGTIEIGNHVRIHEGTRITAGKRIIIEDDALIAPEVFITDHNHGMNPTLAGGYSGQPLIVKPVVIGKGAWLGQRVCVMPGVTIGKHCIIGAGSVVTHDVPEKCMAVGIPARVIKKWNAEQNKWEIAFKQTKQ